MRIWGGLRIYNSNPQASDLTKCIDNQPIKTKYSKYPQILRTGNWHHFSHGVYCIYKPLLVRSFCLGRQKVINTPLPLFSIVSKHSTSTLSQDTIPTTKRNAFPNSSKDNQSDYPSIPSEDRFHPRNSFPTSSTYSRYRQNSLSCSQPHWRMQLSPLFSILPLIPPAGWSSLCSSLNTRKQMLNNFAVETYQQRLWRRSI